MLGFLRRFFRPRSTALAKTPAGHVQTATVRLVRGGYDAAQTTSENRRHWANADNLAADAAASGDIRKTIRARARYEVANNSIAKGIVDTLANDVIGTGPRLQLLTADAKLDQLIEREFGRWMIAADLPEKLRVLRVGKAQDGEGFGLFFTNAKLDHPVKLDVQLLEADQVSTPSFGLVQNTKHAADGIVYDPAGNPIEYHILERHPGASYPMVDPFGMSFRRVPARLVIHYFTPTRAGQHRGLPDILPALGLFAQLRRFTLATLTAAETAADFSVVMKTSSPAGGDAAEVDPWVTMELERNTAMFAPEGWEATQLRAEHPNENYTAFRRAMINEIARCLQMPYNVAAGDSAGYNYASGRLDHQTYFKAIRVERSKVEVTILDRIFAAWLAEALRVHEYGIFRHVERMYWPRAWYWPGFEHVDPLKEAKAAEVLLKAGLLTEAAYQAARGQDWEDVQEQRKRERKGREKRGLEALVGAAAGGAQPGDLADRIASRVEDAIEDAFDGRGAQTQDR